MEENKPSISLGFVTQPFWAMSVEETMAVLDTQGGGLATDEVLLRRGAFGPNSVRERRVLTKTKIILGQLWSPLIMALVVAGAITLFLRQWVDAGVIFAAVAVNTALGFWQEYKAETALVLLKTYIRTRARVRRGGLEREVGAEDLVPGDIVRITQGDRIPADARVIFANNFEVDESVLTGESLPELKSTDQLPAGTILADRTSMVFGGTLAASGFADVAVTAIGEGTEIGRIASLVAKRERESTPLQKSILRFTLKAGAVLGVLVVTLFLLGIYFGYAPFEMFLISVAVAVSAVPEGLPIALTVALAVGVERLAVRKGVVRRLLAAETMGSTTLILTDKTGTLTKAKMELVGVIPTRGSSSEEKSRLFRFALLNTDVGIENPDDPPREWRLFGGPLEIALVEGAAREGILLPRLLRQTHVLDRLPFSSAQKFSGSISRIDSETRLILFGAPDIILKYTNLPPEERSRIDKEIDRLALAGEKVLGVASRTIGEDHEETLHGQGFSDLEFHGLITFNDPLREHVADSMRRIAGAGVRTAILTGDHQGTAEAVARELGMVDGKGAVLTGDDLQYLTPEELRARSGEVSVYARVTPEQKLMLVRLYQEKGEVVAVTGDGVNDAPALQAADIGVAVGSGTDVAKGAADLVLLDDDFDTIVAAIEEGRRILDNIRKIIVYLLSDSLDELLLIGGALLTGLALPINALQILFVNFFSDSLPAIAFAFEKGVDGLEKGPRPERSLFDRRVRFLILGIGVLTSAFLFVLYFFLLRFGFPEDVVRTFIFASFATYTLFLAFSLISLEKSLWTYNPFSNRYLVLGVGIGLLLTALVIYLPWAQVIFHTVSLPSTWALSVILVGLVNIVAVEFSKWLFRKNIL